MQKRKSRLRRFSRWYASTRWHKAAGNFGGKVGRAARKVTDKLHLTTKGKYWRRRKP